MSPQLSRTVKTPLEVSDVCDDLVFGETGQLSLLIPKALISELWAKVNDGTRTLARGGLEVGGLLIGPRVHGETVVVGEIIPLPIEYRNGPSFEMSPSDLAGIAPVIESVGRDQLKVVVGVYRGRARADATLRQSDREILKAIEAVHTSFAADLRCFLVLAPMSESMGLVCVTTCNEGRWGEMQPFAVRSHSLSAIPFPPSTGLHQIPRGSRALEQAIQSSFSNSSAQSPAEQEPQYATEPLAAVRSGARRGRIWLYVVASLVAVALAAGGAYRWALAKQPPAPAVRAGANPPRAHLGFSAAREGPVWKLSWDRAVMDALSPTGAVLTIEDGGYQREVPLAPADLASGTLFYTPQGNDLTFALRIDGGGTNVEEHVRVLGSPIAQPPLGTRPPSVPSNTFLRPRADAPDVTLKRPLAPAAPAMVPTAPPSPVLRSASSAAAAPPATTTAKDSAPPSTVRSEAKSTSASVPPSQVMTLAVPVPPILPPAAATEQAQAIQSPMSTPFVLAPPATEPRTNPTAGPTPARSAQPPVTSPAAPATPIGEPAPATAAVPAAGAVREPIPTGGTPTQAKTNYVGPRPIQQVRPQAPAIVPPGVSQVQVVVDIDARGKVTKVNPVGGTVANTLMTAAIRAASSWVFAPAQLDGHAVASQMSLIFRF